MLLLFYINHMNVFKLVENSIKVFLKSYETNTNTVYISKNLINVLFFTDFLVTLLYSVIVTRYMYLL